MTDNDIIKALEYAESNHRFPISQTLLDQTINLIKCQKAEIERLEKHNSNMALKHYNNGITDGVEMFAKKLRFRFSGTLSCSGELVIREVSKIEKEMVGDNNE